MTIQIQSMEYNMKPVIKQLWEESEKGWGIRPDGYSLHLTTTDRDEYIKDYWDSMQKTPATPSIYSRPSGKGTIIDVDDVEYEQIKKTKNGLRVW